MKLVLKYNQAIKLYTEEIEFEKLITYIQKELNLQKDTIALTFTDQEGDQIVIASDEDLSVMESLVGDKNYIKITVQGNLNTQTAPETKEESLEKKEETEAQKKAKAQEKRQLRLLQKKAEEEKKAQERAQKKAAQEEAKRLKQEKKMQEMAEKKAALEEAKKLKEEKKEMEKEVKKKEKAVRNFDNFHKLMAQTINSLVDEKIKALNSTEEKQENTGATQQSIKQLYEIFFETKQDKPHKQAKEENERLRIYSNNLKALFGGKLIDYKELIETNGELSLKDVVLKYCQTHKISDQEGYSKLLNLYCQRMSKRFGKKPEDYKQFVQENINLVYPQVQKKFNQQLKEQQLQEKSAAKVEAQAKKAAKAEEKSQKKKEKLEKKEAKKEEEKQETPVKVEEKQERFEIKEDPGMHLKGEKRETYQLLVDFYGEENASKYPKFIEENYKFGKERIAQRWGETISIYQLNA